MTRTDLMELFHNAVNSLEELQDMDLLETKVEDLSEVMLNLVRTLDETLDDARDVLETLEDWQFDTPKAQR